MSRSPMFLAIVAIGCLAALCGSASTAEIRVQNVSTHDFTNLSIAGQPYGDFAPGATSDYRSVKLKFRYASMKVWVDGRYVTGQALHFGSDRFTYRIDVRDLAKRQLDLGLIRD